MKVDFADKTVGGFNFEFVRGVSLQAAGAADGECMDTMSRVKNNNFDSWITRWAATADRVAAFAESEGPVRQYRECPRRVPAGVQLLPDGGVLRLPHRRAAYPAVATKQRLLSPDDHADGYCRRVCGYRIRESPAASLLRLRRGGPASHTDRAGRVRFHDGGTLLLARCRRPGLWLELPDVRGPRSVECAEDQPGPDISPRRRKTRGRRGGLPAHPLRRRSRQAGHNRLLDGRLPGRTRHQVTAKWVA